MASLVHSLYDQPNSPIAGAKKRPQQVGSGQKSPPRSSSKGNGQVSSSSSFGMGLYATFTALFSPKGRSTDNEEVIAVSAMEAVTPEGKRASGENSDNSSSKASTASTDSSSIPEAEGHMDYRDDNIEIEEHGEDVFNPYLYMARLPPLHTVEQHPPALKPNKTPFKFCLVLDLDETLVHCSVEPLEKPDIVFPVDFNGTTYEIYARKRPYLEYFLKTVSKQFEICVFTASQQIYADKLLDYIDPEGTLIQHRLFRESCVCVQGNYIKDLHVVGRPLESTMLVDNSPHAYAYNIDNGIPIESWFDDDTDTELLKLIGFLRQMTPATQDVRPVIRDHFKTYKFIDHAMRGGGCPVRSPPI